MLLPDMTLLFTLLAATSVVAPNDNDEYLVSFGAPISTAFNQQLEPSESVMGCYDFISLTIRGYKDCPRSTDSFCGRFNNFKLIWESQNVYFAKAAEIETQSEVMIKFIVGTTPVHCLTRTLQHRDNPDDPWKIVLNPAPVFFEKRLQAKFCGKWADDLDKARYQPFNYQELEKELPISASAAASKILNMNRPATEGISKFVEHDIIPCSQIVYTITEYPSGSNVLYNKIVAGEIDRSFTTAQRIVFRAVEILVSAARRNVYLLDMTTSNLMIDKRGKIMIRDVGLVDLNFFHFSTKSILSPMLTGEMYSDIALGSCPERIGTLLPTEVYHGLISSYRDDKKRYTYQPNRYSAFQMGALYYAIMQCGSGTIEHFTRPEYFDMSACMNALTDRQLDAINKSMEHLDSDRLSMASLFDAVIKRDEDSGDGCESSLSNFLQKDVFQGGKEDSKTMYETAIQLSLLTLRKERFTVEKSKKIKFKCTCRK